MKEVLTRILLKMISSAVIAYLLPAILIMAGALYIFRKKCPEKTKAIKDWFLSLPGMLMVNIPFSGLTWTGLAILIFLL